MRCGAASAWTGTWHRRHHGTAGVRHVRRARHTMARRSTSGRHSTGSAASKQLRSGPNSDVLVYMTVSLSIAYRRLSRWLNNASDMHWGGTRYMPGLPA